MVSIPPDIRLRVPPGRVPLYVYTVRWFNMLILIPADINGCHETTPKRIAFEYRIRDRQGVGTSKNTTRYEGGGDVCLLVLNSSRGTRTI